MDQVASEAEELRVARVALEAARDKSDRMRKAGWHYLNYTAAFRDIAIDVAAIYPVRSRARIDDAAAADATLDAAGAETVPEPGTGNAPA